MSATPNYSSTSDQHIYGQVPNDSQYPFSPIKPRKTGKKKWLKWVIPIAILVVIAAVVGGVLGSRKSSSSSSSPQSAQAAASSAISQKLAIGIFATATNSLYMAPIYPSATNTAAFTSPTFLSSSSDSNTVLTWPNDTFTPSSPSVTTVRTDRPRLIAPAYKWAVLPQLIANDPYLSSWNDTIFGNASTYAAEDPVPYYVDDTNGILDVSRRVKQRVKLWAYAYRMSNDTTWVNRTWTELQNAAGNGTTPFGPDSIDKWNPSHFLDTAEMTAAFGIAYDWLYDQWTADQRSMIVTSMIQYGLEPSVSAVINGNWTGWWRDNGTTGNWNCVCNNGITMGSLAILGDDWSGYAEQLLPTIIDNAMANCAQAPTADGTWTETSDYWYFGTTGHAEMTSSFLTATGSDFGLLNGNPNYYLTAIWHMYVYGQTTLFNYGDTGPNKYTATANGLLLYSTTYDHPELALFQRDRADAADPWSMFWYDPAVSGAFWDGLALDQSFTNATDQWVSMRSSWTDFDGLYVAMKAGSNAGHQTHNDLDAGDFVLDALGTRWAGELGDGDYNAPGYFNDSSQESLRWLYYRKATEGQNTLVVGLSNQNATNVAGEMTFQTTGESQGSSTVYDVPSDSTAYFVADITDAYFNVTSVKRGMRLINGRTQVLIQDEITSSADVQWRMHTNATVTVNSDNTLSLSLDGQTLQMAVIGTPPSGMSITTTDAVRYPSDPTPPEPDQPNPGVTVIVISFPAGTSTLEVLFNPQWAGMSSSDYVTPPSVALDNWTLTSHNSS